MDLHIRGVSKAYANGVQALKDISLTVPAGMYGLLGPNGAGKSTLMRTLATLQQPDQGDIRLGELDVLRQRDAVLPISTVRLQFTISLCYVHNSPICLRPTRFFCSSKMGARD